MTSLLQSIDDRILDWEWQYGAPPSPDDSLEWTLAEQWLQSRGMSLEMRAKELIRRRAS